MTSKVLNGKYDLGDKGQSLKTCHTLRSLMLVAIYAMGFHSVLKGYVH